MTDPKAISNTDIICTRYVRLVFLWQKRAGIKEAMKTNMPPEAMSALAEQRALINAEIDDLLVLPSDQLDILLSSISNPPEATPPTSRQS